MGALHYRGIPPPLSKQNVVGTLLYITHKIKGKYLFIYIYLYVFAI